jgi:hypothetical protein
MTPEYAAIQTNAFFYLTQREIRRSKHLEDARRSAMMLCRSAQNRDLGGM